LQADQVGPGVYQLGYQQVAALTPAVGIMAQVDGGDREFDHGHRFCIMSDQ
jgi:hypothetical protein